MLIDLNADLGEGAGTDADLMPLITSANVCCGMHAGGPDEICEAIELAMQHLVAVGGHPGYPDREHFGRREQALSMDQVIHLCAYQLGAVWSLAGLYNEPIRYVKPHGALYHQACRDEEYAKGLLIGSACVVFNESTVPTVGLPGSELERQTLGLGRSSTTRRKPWIRWSG
jgi:UPF0271 protein